MVAKLLESGWAETVHEDGEAFILKLRAEKGEPPQNVAPDPTKEEEEQLQDEGDDQNAVRNANAPEEEYEDYDDEEDVPPDEEDPENGG